MSALCLSIITNSLCAAETSYSVESVRPAPFVKTTADFEIIGPDALTVAVISERAENLAQFASSHLREIRGNPQPVFIHCLPAREPGKKEARLSIETAGRVSLRLGLVGTSFDKVLLLPQVERLLLRAWIMRWCIWHFGPLQAKVPRWFESALLEAYHVDLNPAYADILGKRVAPLGQELANPLSLIDGKPWSMPAFDAQSYLLFVLLNEEFKDAREKERAWHAILGGRPARWKLQQALPDVPWDPQELRLWFAVGLQHWLDGRESPVQSIGSSRRFLEELRKPAYIDKSGNDQPGFASLQQLAQWPYAEPWQTWAQLQRDRLALLLPEVNPLYHNALQSHGALLEAYMAQDYPQFFRFLEQSEKDWAEAEETARKVHSLLRQATNDPAGSEKAVPIQEH